MRKKETPLLSSRPKRQIRDFVDDEKSLGRATKSQIAAAIGIRPSHFSNLLNGRNEWKLNQLEKLADFLGVPITRLFEERGKDTAVSPSEHSGQSPSEDRIIRALRIEARSLRSGLRADVDALLRERATDPQTVRTEDYARDDTPAAFPDAPINLPGALPIEIRDLDALYDGSLTDPASGSLWFKRDWLRRHGLDYSQCLIVRVQGESMETALPDGCSVLVNRGERQRRVGRIYALRTEAGLVVRRAGRDNDGRWRLESDHPDWEPVPWPDEAEVIGQVCWMARTL